MNFEGAPAESESKYGDKAMVNGVEISVGWDSGYDDYTIYFPGIEMTSQEAQDKGVFDQVIRISDNPEDAKKVFEYAKKVAEEESNLYNLFKKVEAFVHELS